ncbi:hypothetical protein GCM10022204_08350 [Microlunatus aurantiacus]|uniref:AI-2E family transporter n=1 Tax=Microlunatus aurantiacus TaxID=446786 RepID=A0ABP7CWE6_9ACTN
MADQRRKPDRDDRRSPHAGRSPKAGAVPPPPSTGNRKQVEDTSRPLLVRLSSMPRLVVPFGTLVLVALGLFAPLPIALPALALVFFFFAWIAYLSWPVVPTGGKVLRGVMLGLVLAMAVSRF